MPETNNYKYLYDINSPKDLRNLPESALKDVSNEVREFVIDTITKVGGHFGAGLGIVELTVALHYVFDTPKDKIVIDTGHQGYPHKVLTGRRDELHTIRQKDGLSGFLKRSESLYDVFGAGHASTSISAGLGLATARDIKGEDYKVVSIIGDGAMTGGLAFEALNNCGFQKRNMLVILNDNNFSISPNVSALSNYFSELFTSEPAKFIRENLWNITGKMDHVGDRLRKIASKLEEGVKAVITPGALFEALGFNYIGPINGNNVFKLVKILNAIKDMNGPIFLHIMTQKGYGYEPASKDYQFLHAIGKIDKVTGKSLAKKEEKPKPMQYQDVFGNAVLELCKEDKNIVAITAAMPTGTGLNLVQNEMPERVIDVGIAEGHAVTMAAGMACEGVIPIVAIYSTFLQRAFDHIIHDVALQHLHVIFALDRAGLVGADGPTHHGVLDLAYLRIIPEMIVMAPKDEQELRDMIYTATYDVKNQPVSIRFPRGNSVGVEMGKMKSIPIGKSEIIREGTDICLFAIGKLVSEATLAAEELNKLGISVEVINARFVKPLDTEMVDYIANKFDTVITLEDGQKSGGFGSAVLEYLNEQNYNLNLIIHGIDDKFIDHGTQEELYSQLKLDSKGITELVINKMNERVVIDSDY